MGNEWVKRSKIRNYFKSSQKYPLRFKKNKISYYDLGRFEMLIKLVIFAKIAIIQLYNFYSMNLWIYIEKLELGAILQR